MKLDHKIVGIILAVVVFTCSVGISYLLLDHFYGRGVVETRNLEEPKIQAEMEYSQKEIVRPASLNILSISSTIGIAMATIAILAWSGSTKITGSTTQVQGNATTLLLSEGLEDMTVRDVELVGQMMRRKEFTIPQLYKKSQVSRSSVWKLVKKNGGKGTCRGNGQGKTARKWKG